MRVNLLCASPISILAWFINTVAPAGEKLPTNCKLDKVLNLGGFCMNHPFMHSGHIWHAKVNLWCGHTRFYPYCYMLLPLWVKILWYIRYHEIWPNFTIWPWNLTMKFKFCFGNWMFMIPWTMMFLSDMVASFEQETPSSFWNTVDGVEWPTIYIHMHVE